MTCGELLFHATRFLRQSGVDSPRVDAEVLLAFLWNTSRVEMLVFPERDVPEIVEKEFWSLAKKRAAGVPVAYLTGEKEFMALSFLVNSSVLIPRPETELLVEEALSYLKTLKKSSSFRHPFLVADVGTGSGAIAVSLAYYDLDVRVVGIDVSTEALSVAEENARRHGVSERVQFQTGDLLEPLLSQGYNQVGAAVVANLPYIPSAEIDTLPRDVKYEPLLALDGGFDGLDLYRRLVPQAAAFLAGEGFFACEVGSGQAEVLSRLLEDKNWEKIHCKRDYRGIKRLVTALRKGRK